MDVLRELRKRWGVKERLRRKSKNEPSPLGGSIRLKIISPLIIGQEKMDKHKIWKITDKGLNLLLEWNDFKSNRKTGGEFRELMKNYSPVLESGKTIKEEVEENE